MPSDIAIFCKKGMVLRIRDENIYMQYTMAKCKVRVGIIITAKWENFLISIKKHRQQHGSR